MIPRIVAHAICDVAIIRFANPVLANVVHLGRIAIILFRMVASVKEDVIQLNIFVKSSGVVVNQLTSMLAAMNSNTATVQRKVVNSVPKIDGIVMEFMIANPAKTAINAIKQKSGLATAYTSTVIMGNVKLAALDGLTVTA